MRLALALTLAASLAACGAPGLSPYAACRTDTPAYIDTGGQPYTGLAPELLVPDVDTGVAYYRDKLGFQVIHNAAAERSCFAAVQYEDDVVLLSHVNRAFQRLDNQVEFRFLVSDPDASYAQMMAAGAELVRELGNAEYGLREYVVRDPYGARLRFAAPIP